MRILAIRGRNLASLARSFAVELEHGPLAGAGLFAITGPVGAGKSTLLDALCLPLFDRTPRLSGRGGTPIGEDGENPADWLRANDPRTLLRRDAAEGHAEVDFVGRDGVRYRAQWRVRRARRRADGRVQEQELQLDDLDRGVVVAGGRRSDVLAAVQQRLGLDFAQFCRSVLLAQGDFAAFLKASADERARLLETLTGADIYRRLSKAAHERARLCAHEVARLQAQFEAQAPMAAEARAAVERSVAQLGTQLATCQVGIDLASRYVAWHDAAALHRQGESEATVALQAAVAAHDAAGERREQLDRRQRALAVVPRWEVAVAAAAAAASAAANLATARSQQAEATQRAGVAAERLREAAQRAFGAAFLEAVPAVVREFPQWEPLLLQWQTAADGIARATSALPGLETSARHLAAQVAELGAAGTRVAQRLVDAAQALEAAQAAAVQSDQEALARQRRELEERRAAATRWHQLAAAWAEADAAVAQAQQRAQGVQQEGDAAQRLAEAATTQRTQAVAAVAAAQARRDAVRTRAGLADLRARLVAGQACPLCGATDHPLHGGHDDTDLAAATAEVAACDHVLAAADRELAKARGDEQANRRERERAVAEVATRVAAAARAAAAFGAAAPAEAPRTAGPAVAWAATQQQALAPAFAVLEAAEGAARAAAAALQAAVQTAAAAQTAWQDVERRRLTAEQRLAEALRVRDQTQAALAAEQARVAAVQAGLAPACAGLQGGPQALLAMPGDRVGGLRALHTLHGASLAAVRAVDETMAAVGQATTVSERAAAEAATLQQGFAKALAVAAVAREDVVAVAELGPEALAVEAAALRALAAEVERCRTVLRERVQQRRRHEDHERPSLAAEDAAAALRDARASYDIVQKRVQDARVELAADDLVRRQRDELAPRLTAAERTQATWQALDDLIGSSSGDAFAVFAQGLTLDLLLLEANRRLAELARRYRLHKNPEAELDFVVVDLDLGGTRRSLQSLSGGETFLVSLALALALATLAAPKSRVETLFLDEGFGTLDAQSLEIALGALDSLQATGCQVGVISHVDGIAERIGAQVVVQPEGGGQSRVFAQAR